MVSLCTFLFLLYSTNVFVEITAANRYLGYKFLRHFDLRLTCDVFSTLKASSMDCQDLCTEDIKCFSVNTFKLVSGEDRCELVKSSITASNSSCMVQQKGAVNHELSETHVCSEGHCTLKEKKEAGANGWYTLGRYKYKLSQELKTWDDAKVACTASGGALLTIDTKQELDLVTGLFMTSVSDVVDKMSPQHYWKLDGNDADVKLVGAANFTSHKWIRPKVLKLPGISGSYATTPTVGITDKSFTISVWLSVTSLSSTPGSQNPIYTFWQSQRYIFLFSYTMSGLGHIALMINLRRKNDPSKDLVYILRQPAIPTTNRWVHLAWSWDYTPGNITVYLDGKSLGSKIGVAPLPQDMPTPPNPLTDRFDIGYKDDTRTVSDALVSGLAVFFRVLTPEEVQTIAYQRLVWISKNHTYTNFATSLQDPAEPCVALQAYESYQMDKVKCDAKIPFICKIPVT